MSTDIKKNSIEENRLDNLLTKILNGDFSEWESLNRLEKYLVCILTKKDLEDLGKPLNRLEVLLQALYTITPENAVEVLAARLEEQ
jgi:hypothetical protein